MQTEELVEILKSVAPALAAKPQPDQEVMSCFWMEEGRGVTTFDNLVGLVYDFEECPVTANVHGSKLLSWLGTLSGKEMKIEGKGGNVTFRAGRSHITLPHVESSVLWFEEPDMEDASQLELGPISDAIRHVLPCMGTDPGMPTLMGILLDCHDLGVDVYATDGNIAARSFLEVDTGDLCGNVVALHPRFVEIFTPQMTEESVLLFGASFIGAFLAPNFALYGRVLLDSDAEDLGGLFGEQDAILGDAVPIPSGFDAALKRAEVITSSSKGTAAAEMEVRGDKLIIMSSTPGGKTQDVLRLKGEHEAIKLPVDPSMVRKVLDGCDRLCITETALWLAGPHATYVVSGLGLE